MTLELTEKELKTIIGIIEGAYSVDIESSEMDSYLKERIKEYKLVKKVFKNNGYDTLPNLKK